MELDDKLKSKLRQVGSQANSEDPLVLAKFYSSKIGWKWYVIDYNFTRQEFFD